MMIHFENVQKSFQGLFRPVLDGLNFHLEKGDFCVLIGMNGCGKSTLLKLISGVYPPDSGSVLIGARVAQVVQDVHLGTAPSMTLLENLVLSSQEKPMLRFYRRYRACVMEELKALGMGLEAYWDHPVGFLSGGQRQMMATLMSVRSGAEILLLDEHTSALDPKMQGFLMDYTAKKIEELGLTTVMVTHRMDDALKYGNRLILLNQGKIVLDVQGKQKQILKVADLLSLFHHCEDPILAHGGEDDD